MCVRESHLSLRETYKSIRMVKRVRLFIALMRHIYGVLFQITERGINGAFVERLDTLSSGPDLHSVQDDT